MYQTEYVTPWVQMRARDENTLRAAKFYPVLEPFAPRYSISYFNNNKEDSTKSAYERLHSAVDYDPAKPRCDRTKPSLYWLEISKENNCHKVPMTSNHWYGRPNRIQVDFPEKKFNRSSKMLEFYSRAGLNLISEDERRAEVC
ncbi:uncharacterized protein LOC122404120 [Colletes gigas]|uniref:uncharacterized protein LOC122404120 n=1 Tax=Colletes gigas TaxID=935657 RepID=UPI001C9B8EF7|nr:uncharacterized protein LOC122404120 [Colletes gigas]